MIIIIITFFLHGFLTTNNIIIIGDNDELTVRFATSLISHEQALSNLEQEVGVTTKKTFDDIYDEAKR